MADNDLLGPVEPSYLLAIIPWLLCLQVLYLLLHFANLDLELRISESLYVFSYFKLYKQLGFIDDFIRNGRKRKIAQPVSKELLGYAASQEHSLALSCSFSFPLIMWLLNMPKFSLNVFSTAHTQIHPIVMLM